MLVCLIRHMVGCVVPLRGGGADGEVQLAEAFVVTTAAAVA